MKKKSLLLLSFLVSLFANSLVAQVTPITSTEATPVWYYIESAAVTSLGSPNATLTGILPLKGKNYVLYSPATTGKIKYRIQTSTNDELWAVVLKDGKKYLLNKATGLYMRGSHTAGSYWANDSVRIASLGDGQFSIRTSVTEAANSTTVNNSFTIAWNSLTCDRWGSAAINTNTAWYFKDGPSVVQTPLEQAITAAKSLLNAQSKEGIHPGQYNAANRTAFATAIAAAELVQNNSGSTQQQKDDALTALNAEVQTYKNAKNKLMISNGENTYWYFIKSQRGSSATALFAENQGVGKQPLNKNLMVTAPQIWKIIEENGGYYIQSYSDNSYMNADIANNTIGSQIATKPTKKLKITLSPHASDGIDFVDYFLIENSEGAVSFRLHAGAGGHNWGLMNYTNDATDNCSFQFYALTAAEAASESAIGNVEMKLRYTETGIGNKNHSVAYAVVGVEGLAGQAQLKSLDISFNETTNINAIKKLNVYVASSDTKVNEAQHTLIATLDNPSSATQTYTVTLPTPYALTSGSTNLHFAVDVADAGSANEGDKLVVNLNKLTYTNGTDKDYVPTVKKAPYPSTVFLVQSAVLTPGDYNSASYRIPAVIVANDGAIVTLTDKRKNNDVDLPQDIDVVARRSTDGGKTWSAPVTVAQGTGYGNGFGDVCVLKTSNGKLVALYVGGPGYFSSTPSAPIRSYVSFSSDNGQTWTAPQNITSQIFGDGCADPVRATWQGSFFGSGRGLTLRDGRLMAVISARGPGFTGSHNYAVYSDDEGLTWNVSDLALTNGDEAKVVELNDGTILMSSRTGGNRRWAKSTDKGLTWTSNGNWPQIWGNACDADIVRFTSTVDGFNKNRLLHTLPNANGRENLTMWISYDEGSTWGTKKTICPVTSAYSSIVSFDDGTIGVYYETDNSKSYTMSFVRFSLNWLTNGTDTYLPATGMNTEKLVNKNIKALVKNGYVAIVGTDSPFKLYNISGVEMSPKAKLNAGVYVVNVDNESIKLIVK